MSMSKHRAQLSTFLVRVGPTVKRGEALQSSKTRLQQLSVLFTISKDVSVVGAVHQISCDRLKCFNDAVALSG